MQARIEELFSKTLKKKSKDVDQLFLTAFVKEQRGVSIFESQVNSVELSDEVKIGLLVNVKGRWGSASVECLDEDVLKRAIEQAAQAAPFNDPNPDFTLAPPATAAPSPAPDLAIASLGLKDLEVMGLKAEKQALDFSPLIKNIPYTGVGAVVQTRVFANSMGARYAEKNHYLWTHLSIMSQGSDGRMVNASQGRCVNHRADLDLESFVTEVSKEAIERVNPRPVASGAWPIFLDARSSVHLLSTFSDVFSGEALYKKLTRLEGKLGQKIASDQVTLIDDPQAGLVPHSFDAEGTPCQKKFLIEKGILRSFLHNRHSANKTGMTSTGNAEGGLGLLPGVSITNLFWDGAGKSPEELMGSVDQGILIRELHGASASSVSGDFSFGALGYWVEKGKIQYPVADFTVAGNFFEVLQSVQGVGNDLRFLSPHPMGSIGGRTLFISSLSVSGKENT